MQNEYEIRFYKDGTVDTRTRFQRRMDAIGVSLAPLNKGIREALNEWDLYEYDKRHNTHLLTEYRAKRQKAKYESMRRAYGLV